MHMILKILDSISYIVTYRVFIKPISWKAWFATYAIWILIFFFHVYLEYDFDYDVDRTSNF